MNYINQNDCPCYVCIVASMCPGKEPTVEEMEAIPGSISFTREEIITKQECPYYQEWKPFNFTINRYLVMEDI